METVALMHGAHVWAASPAFRKSLKPEIRKRAQDGAAGGRLLEAAIPSYLEFTCRCRIGAEPLDDKNLQQHAAHAAEDRMVSMRQGLAARQSVHATAVLPAG